MQSPGITLETWEDSPFYALERDLVKFTYKEGFNIAYLLPVIVLVLFSSRAPCAPGPEKGGGNGWER